MSSFIQRLSIQAVNSFIILPLKQTHTMNSKCFGLILAILLCGLFSNAQFYKSFVPSPAFTDSLNRIVADFRHNYHSIQGEALGSQNDVDTYQSKNSLPGAVECFIYRFHSVQDTTASFQAVMYKGDSFKEAVKIYKNTFRLVNKTKLKPSGGFTGQMEEPNESMRFISSSMKANTSDDAYKNYIAEVEILNSYDGWEVHLNLHTKKDDRDKF
jgi:hypothetical protein